MKYRIDRYFYGHRMLIFGILCLFGISLLAGTSTFVPKKKKTAAQGADDKKVYLIHSDELFYNKFQNPEAQILRGNVAFRHGTMYMYCDSACYYEASNSFEAFGNVRMKQGDTLSLRGKHLYYDGEEQLAQLREDVKLRHKTTTLTTDSLDYDRIYNLGYFMNGGTMIDGDNVLTSDWGEYNTGTKMATFNYHVKLVNPKYTLTSDTLRYNTTNGIANIVGPSDIYSDDNHIYSELGFYDTRSDRARMFGRSKLSNNDGKSLIGDSLFYERKTGVGKAFRNIVYTDTVNKNGFTGNYCYYNEKTGYAVAYDSAVAIDFSQGPDTLYMHADTFRLQTFNIETDSAYRKMHAYHKVRAFRKDVQAVCDSLVFNSKDSCMTMYDNPIVWNNNQQLVGEEISVYMRDSTIDWAHVQRQAMSVEKMDSTHYNQVSGKEMKAFFTDGKMHQADVLNNVRSIYYPLDDDSLIIGLNYAETSKLSLFIKENKLQKIIMSPQSNGVLYPLDQAPENKRYLDGFAWFDYIRPTDKDDIFNWRGKKKEQELVIQNRRSAPLQKLKKKNKTKEE